MSAVLCPFYFIGKSTYEIKPLRGGTHCGGAETCRLYDPPQAEKSASGLLFTIRPSREILPIAGGVRHEVPGKGGFRIKPGEEADSSAEIREQWSAKHPAGEAGTQEEEKERIPGKMRKHWKRRMIAAVLAISVWITSLTLDTVQVNADLIKRYIPSEEFDRTQNLTVDPLSYLEEKDKEKSQQHYILEEALERRDEGVKHFVMEDGSGAAVVYGKPVHYEEEGEWKEIDNRLEKTEGEDGKEYYQNTASDVRIRLAGEALAEKLVSISNDGKELSWKLSAGNGEEGTEETGSGEGTEGAAGEISAEEGTSEERTSGVTCYNKVVTVVANKI